MSKNRKLKRLTGKAGYWACPETGYPWWEISIETGNGFYPVVQKEQYRIWNWHRRKVSFRITRKGRAADIKLA